MEEVEVAKTSLLYLMAISLHASRVAQGRELIDSSSSPKEAVSIEIAHFSEVGPVD